MDRELATDDTRVVASEKKDRKGLWLLLGTLLGLLLGLLFGGTIGGLLGFNEASNNSSNNSNSSTSANDSHDHHADTGTFTTNGVSMRLAGLEGLSMGYAQALNEAVRESTDAPSSEATAAQQRLTLVTEELAAAMATKLTAKGTVSENSVKERLTALNQAAVQYATASAGGTADESSLNSAVTELGTILTNSFEVNDSKQLNPLMTSFKNSLMEANRSFVGEKYDVAYAKYATAQADFVKGLATLKSK